MSCEPGKTSTSCGGFTMQEGRFDTTPLLKFTTSHEHRLLSGGTNASDTAIRLQPSPWSLAVIAAMTATKRPSVGVTVGLSLIGAATQQLRQRAPDLTVGEARKIVIRGTQATATALGRAIRRVWWPLLVLLCPISRSARRLLAASAVFAVTPMVAVDDVAHGVGSWSGVIKHRRFGPVIPVLRRSRPQPGSHTP